jgi:hypothetical protein
MTRVAPMRRKIDREINRAIADLDRLLGDRVAG